jgi:hypothetical protein
MAIDTRSVSVGNGPHDEGRLRERHGTFSDRAISVLDGASRTRTGDLLGAIQALRLQNAEIRTIWNARKPENIGVSPQFDAQSDAQSKLMPNLKI